MVLYSQQNNKDMFTPTSTTTASSTTDTCGLTIEYGSRGPNGASGPDAYTLYTTTNTWLTKPKPKPIIKGECELCSKETQLHKEDVNDEVLKLCLTCKQDLHYIKEESKNLIQRIIKFLQSIFNK